MLRSQRSHLTTYPQLRQLTKVLYPRRLRNSMACRPARRHSPSRSISSWLKMERFPASSSRRMSTTVTFGRGSPRTRRGISTSV